jgi:hypothetical protein
VAKKESSAEMASIASRIMLMAGKGGAIESHRAALRHALRSTDPRVDFRKHPPSEDRDAVADVLIDAMKAVLQPFTDDAESLAASVLGQRESKK